MSTQVRVRFAPSPTGPLHIGGVRTALYNYLFAKKHGGTFILRIEDTDQTRYVPGAEQYIIDSLLWFGMAPQEGPGFGGDYGPYRQSERKPMYKQYVDELIAKGHAYYAFDTPEELDAYREKDKEFKYDGKTRMSLRNSLTLSTDETQALLDAGQNIAIRLKVPVGETVSFVDEIRGNVSFDSSELDDKVMLKGDGMPTYHLANIVDDHLMKISHVIRGEEWLPSTAHHVLLYRFFGWTAPSFSHLPLILKPTGQGKLSKRDGAKFGFPVFPLSWNDPDPNECFSGFKDDGFLPEAVINFLALLGWSPGDDQEMFDMNGLINAFSLEKIVKSGARFDFEKAKWFNQQYVIDASNETLATMIQPQAKLLGFNDDIAYLSQVCGQMKERVHKVDEILENGRFFFEQPSYDMDTVSKKYKSENSAHFVQIADSLRSCKGPIEIEAAIKGYIADNGLKMGEIMPIMRIAVSGTMQGPDLVQTINILGVDKSADRIESAINVFDKE